MILLVIHFFPVNYNVFDVTSYTSSPFMSHIPLMLDTINFFHLFFFYDLESLQGCIQGRACDFKNVNSSGSTCFCQHPLKKCPEIYGKSFCHHICVAALKDEDKEINPGTNYFFFP